jgi:lipopolysaccharide export system protein LptA
MRKFSPFRSAVLGAVVVSFCGLEEARAQNSGDAPGRPLPEERAKGNSGEVSKGAVREALKGAVQVGEAAAKAQDPRNAAREQRDHKGAAATTITAKTSLLLDSKNYEATFFGEVTVSDPRFTLSCEKLTAYLKRPAVEAKPGAGVKNAAGAKAGEGGEAGSGKLQGEAVPKAGGGGVDKAVAEGDVVIMQEKLNDKGEVERSVGRAQKAVYDAVTGNITLSGWPQVEQKQNTIVGAEERTVIVLNAKGTLEVLGRSKSVLRSTAAEEVR